MQPILHLKEHLWSNLLTIAFLLTLAAVALWLDHHSHGDINVIVWIFAAIFVLLCGIPISSIRKPKTRLLAIDGYNLYWRIYNAKTNETILEKRLVLSSIRGLKWIAPYSYEHRGHDFLSARLLFITSDRASHTLPDEFHAAHHRRKIEAVLKQKIPDLKIIEQRDKKT